MVHIEQTKVCTKNLLKFPVLQFLSRNCLECLFHIHERISKHLQCRKNCASIWINKFAVQAGTLHITRFCNKLKIGKNSINFSSKIELFCKMNKVMHNANKISSKSVLHKSCLCSISAEQSIDLQQNAYCVQLCINFR